MVLVVTSECASAPGGPVEDHAGHVSNIAADEVTGPVGTPADPGDRIALCTRTPEFSHHARDRQDASAPQGSACDARIGQGVGTVVTGKSDLSSLDISDSESPTAIGGARETLRDVIRGREPTQPPTGRKAPAASVQGYALRAAGVQRAAPIPGRTADDSLVGFALNISSGGFDTGLPVFSSVLSGAARRTAA